ncbi:hypothetical protein [Chitinophaga niabensis]|uniref:Uncharacterized protein n=1 Tax=Chitinophaga niabensis TaxID=536979 RepID=A0A1N6E5F5_9BACT|nr:hypothetical protein [Chitinophaga niabensis]SIN78157.1 hypothetical protein SAMN04488055_1311 [Chitinophaga niabensis]
MKRNIEKPLSDQKAKIARQIAARVIYVQQKWAGTMTSLAGKFSISAQKKILVTGTALAAVFCFSLIMRTFSTGKVSNTKDILPVSGAPVQQQKQNRARNADWEKIREMNPALVDSLWAAFINKQKNIKLNNNGKSN